MDIKSIESQDADIIESALVALREVWKKKIFVLLITIAGILAALIYVSIKGNTTRYYSSATLFSAVYGSYSDTTEGVAVMNRYTDLMRSSRVCNRAAQLLSEYHISAEDLQAMVMSDYIKVSGANSNSTSYGYRLTVSAYADSAEVVMPIANAMASAFATELNELIGSNAIQVMDEATRYGAYRTMRVPLYLALFAGAAFAGTCGIIFCLAFFSPWVRSVEQCEHDEDLVLGLLPYTKER